MFETTQRVGVLKNSVPVVIAGAPIALFDQVKHLGVTFDARLSFNKHVINICRGCYFHIR